MTTNRFHLYCVANDAGVLARDLQNSPEIAGRSVPLSVLWNAASASSAYARAVDGADADYLVFAHQDIYFPRGWFDRLTGVLDRLSRNDDKWAVAGLFGVTHGGRLVGHVWDSGLGRVCGAPFAEPVRAASLDEIVLIVRRAANVRFDPELPCFHLYGADIVLTAEASGETAYVIDLPAIHNAKPVRRLGPDYIAAYRFMVRKWRHRLPWPTVILPLTESPTLLAVRRLSIWYRAVFRASTLSNQLPDPASKARELGFETL
jgi:hypothetical protein